MRRLKYGLCGMSLTLAVLTGCGSGSTDTVETASKVETAGEQMRIVTTIFPEYDWVREVIGENADGVDLTLLLDNGVDLHSYQPTADDMMKIADCDLFIYVGGESDEWVEDALAEAVNPNQVVINLLEVLGDDVKEEELVEGMEAEDEEEDDEGEEEPEYDEHVWLSLGNAEKLVTYLAEQIGTLDTAHKEAYQENAALYVEKLEKLDQAYQQAVEEAPVHTLVFGDRFPFRYLTDDYGLDYYAAFVGCSAETEASFETIVFLTDKINELDLHSVLTIEGTDHKIAETIVQNTKTKDQQILTLDSMQGTTAKDMDEGETYLSIMEKNLDVLKEALQ
ncbi:MAG: zinc ABC transporter substrate-binding protein [Lachnospiraceae bacterium]|nr:zinc ABC transporter substrate-binding protein [Lachnospiraceae bacterium]